MADKTTIRTDKDATLPSSAPPDMATRPLTLRDEVDRLFDAFFPAAFARTAFGFGAWPRLAGDIAPRMNVAESAERYDVSVELPGMDLADVSVGVQGDMLTISGEKKVERADAALHLSERVEGAFARSLRLPDDVDCDAIRADFAKGVLTVTLPRRPADKAARKIEVTTH